MYIYACLSLLVLVKKATDFTFIFYIIYMHMYLCSMHVCAFLMYFIYFYINVYLYMNAYVFNIYLYISMCICMYEGTQLCNKQ